MNKEYNNIYSNRKENYMEKKEKTNIHHLFWYFLIFSILGLIIETVYCYATMGILESRKGFIWGPFCPVYGVCGAGLIYVLDKLNSKSVVKLFICGFVFGSIAEYILSFGLEAIYGIRFWNYDYLAYNLNGRISILFSFYWGVLAILLIKFVKPLIDKIVAKIKPHTRNIIELGIFIFLIIDCVVTVWAIQTYQNRVVYNKTYHTNSNNIILKVREKIENDYFTNNRISMKFPNLRTKDENGNEGLIRDLIENN